MSAVVPRPIEEVLPKEKRDALRRAGVEQRGWYSPWAHLGATTLIGATIIAVAAAQLQGLRWYHALFAAAVFVFSNAVEWRVHRDALHRPFPLLRVLYDRHTPVHHVIYVRDDMEIRDAREFRLVLIPAYGIAAIFVFTSPLTAALWIAGQRNLAAIFAMVTMGYVVMYEWLHLAYHLPARGLVGRLRLVRALRRHHAIHHDPRLMQRWNMNVTFPIWDRVRGTWVRES